MTHKLCLTLLLAGLLSACASDSKVAKPEPLRKIVDPEVRAEKVWSSSLGAPRELTGLRPLLAAGRVFVAERSGKLRSFDAQGKVIWQVQTGLRLSAGPALVDGALILGTLDGEVVAMEAQDGQERWRASLSSEVISLPAGEGDLVAVRSGDGRVYGLSASDGERRWTVNRAVPALTLRGSGPLVVGRRAVFVGMDNGRVLALGRDDGEPLWEEAVSVPAGRTEIERIVDVDADLLLIENVLFAASYGGDLVAYEAGSGRVLWQRSLASYTGMAVDGQCLYVTDVDSVLWCLDPRNGAAIWEQNQLKHRKLSAPLAYRGNVLVGDYEGYMHVVSAVNGRIIGRSRATGEAIRAPMQQDEEQRIYVLDSDGRLQVMRWNPLGNG